MANRGTASSVSDNYPDFAAEVLRHLPRQVDPEAWKLWSKNGESMAEALAQLADASFVRSLLKPKLHQYLEKTLGMERVLHSTSVALSESITRFSDEQPRRPYSSFERRIVDAVFSNDYFSEPLPRHEACVNTIRYDISVYRAVRPVEFLSDDNRRLEALGSITVNNVSLVEVWMTRLINDPNVPVCVNAPPANPFSLNQAVPRVLRQDERWEFSLGRVMHRVDDHRVLYINIPAGDGLLVVTRA